MPSASAVPGAVLVAAMLGTSTAAAPAGASDTRESGAERAVGIAAPGRSGVLRISRTMRARQSSTRASTRRTSSSSNPLSPSPLSLASGGRACRRSAARCGRPARAARPLCNAGGSRLGSGAGAGRAQQLGSGGWMATLLATGGGGGTRRMLARVPRSSPAAAALGGGRVSPCRAACAGCASELLLPLLLREGNERPGILGRARPPGSRPGSPTRPDWRWRWMCGMASIRV